MQIHEPVGAALIPSTVAFQSLSTSSSLRINGAELHTNYLQAMESQMRVQGSSSPLSRSEHQESTDSILTVSGKVTAALIMAVGL